MYVTLRGGQPDKAQQAGGSGAAKRVSGTVVLLGVVSMLTDISSESVSAILPLYITTVLGLGPLAYGFVDGLYQGVSALVRILGGRLADRGDHPKWVAVAGYGLSAITRLALLPASGLASITAVVSVDRLGKGLRTAPRDALISASTEPAMLGRAFGVHRAMDTFGALLGPLLAFLVLYLVPGSYDSVFVLSFLFAAVGLAVLLLFVPDLRPRRALARRAAVDHADASRTHVSPTETSTTDTSTTGDGADVLRAPSWRLLADPRLSRLLLVAAALGVLTIGDGFLYLALQRRDDFATEYFPLLYVGTNFAYLALAVPLGRLADRIGRAKVFVGGHVALLLAYASAAGPLEGVVATVGCLLLLGTFYAATDGMLAALAGRLVDPSVRASGIATAQTVVALARFASAIGFGLLWQSFGRDAALWVVAGALLAVLPLAARLVGRLDTDDRSAVPAP